MTDRSKDFISVSKIPIWLVAITVFAATYLGAFLVFYPTWHRLERIAHDGRTTIGTVIQKEPYNHESVRFEYSVDDIKYFGKAAAGRGGLPSFEAIHVGDPIPVTYWRERPSESVGGDRSDVYKTMSFILFVLAPCLCLFFGILAAIGVRNRTTSMWPDIIDRLVRRKTVSH